MKECSDLQVILSRYEYFQLRRNSYILGLMRLLNCSYGDAMQFDVYFVRSGRYGWSLVERWKWCMTGFTWGYSS